MRWMARGARSMTQRAGVLTVLATAVVYGTVLVIPATAILSAPYGDSVFVVDEKKNEKTGQLEKKLRQQFIRVGASRGDFVNVESGLKAGEQIVQPR